MSQLTYQLMLDCRFWQTKRHFPLAVNLLTLRRVRLDTCPLCRSARQSKWFFFVQYNPILSTIPIKYGGKTEIMSKRVIFHTYTVKNEGYYMKAMRSALVVGATGLVGSNLVKLLCDSDEYVAVNVISRRPLDYFHPKLVVTLREFDQIAESDIEFAHEVFCCLGTTMKKAGSKEQFEKVDFEYPMTIAALAKHRGLGISLSFPQWGRMKRRSHIIVG